MMIFTDEKNALHLASPFCTLQNGVFLFIIPAKKLGVCFTKGVVRDEVIEDGW